MPISKADFSHDAPGRLVDTVQGVPAFIPNPLPPALNLADYVEDIARAMEALGILKGLVELSETDPYLVIYSLFRREAIFSSKIEGTFTTPKQMALLEVGGTPTATSEDVSEDTREVLNYVNAIRSSWVALKEGGTVNHAVIRGAHGILLDSVRGHAMKGKYRDVQNFIGKEYQGIASARFVPAPPFDAKAAMDDLVGYISGIGQGKTTLPILIHLALIHYQFETIHPFEDGNGRIGRMMMPMILLDKKVIKEPILHLSAAIDKRRPEYLDQLLNVSKTGVWSNWIKFFLEIVAESAQDASALVKAITKLKKDYKIRATGKRVSNFIPKLIDYIFQHPTITFNQAKDELKVSHAQAAVHVRLLEKLGMLVEVEGRARNKVYYAKELFALIWSGSSPA